MVPDGDIVVHPVDSIAVYEDEAVTLGCVLVEIILVLGRGHAMASDPSGRRFLYEDGRETRIVVDCVTANPSQVVALGSQLVEGVLVLGRRIAMDRSPLGLNWED